MSASFDTLEQIRFGKKGRSEPHSLSLPDGSADFDVPYGDSLSGSVSGIGKSQLAPLEAVARGHLVPLMPPTAGSGPGHTRLEPLGAWVA